MTIDQQITVRVALMYRADMCVREFNIAWDVCGEERARFWVDQLQEAKDAYDAFTAPAPDPTPVDETPV